MRTGPALVGLVLLAGLVRLSWFLQTPHPLGTDGYYYVVQTADLARTGHLHVPDSSWVFGLYGLIGQVCEPVLASKLAAVLLSVLVIPAAWWAGAARSSAAGRGLALWMAASPTVTQLAADFPKNLGVAAPWFLLCAAADRSGRTRWLVVPAVLLLGGAHRMGAVWALVGLAAWSLFALRRRLDGRVVGLASLALAGLLVGGRFLPGLLGLGDRFRLEGQLALGAVSPFAWFPLRPFHPLQQLELALGWVGLAAGLGLLARGRGRPSIAMSTAFLAVCLLPVYADGQLDLGYRLSLMLPLAAALPLVEATSTVLERVSSQRAVLAGLFVPLTVLGVDPTDLPPYDRYLALIERIPRPLPPLLIAHQGINFLYDHRTGEEAMAWAPDPDLSPETVGRIVWGVRGSEWVGLGVERVQLDDDYAYVDEPTWRHFLERVAAEGDPDLQARVDDWRNPSRVRPAALLRGR